MCFSFRPRLVGKICCLTFSLILRLLVNCVIFPITQNNRFIGSELAMGLARLTNLTSLFLAGTSLEDDSLALICSSFSCLGRLANLDLSSNLLALAHEEVNIPVSFAALTALEVSETWA